MATTKQSTTKRASKASKAGAAAKRTALAKTKPPVTLVTGGTGFLGAHLVRLLVGEGVKNVRVLATGAPPWAGELGVEVVTGSVTSAADAARAVEGAAEVYHLAGRVSRAKEDAHLMYSVHVEGTRTLCDAARAAGVKSIVLASTSGTVAVSEDSGAVADEDWPAPVEIITRWPYYASKLYQERVAREHFSGKGLRLVVVNPTLLLGPGDERLSSTKVVLDFLARKIMTVPSGGLSFVDARDAAQALRAAMDSGRDGDRYLLGAANWTFEEFFGRLERLTKISAPRVRLPSKLALAGARGLSALYTRWKLAPPVEPAEVEMADYFWYVDSRKAQRELGFAPRDPQETLLDTVNYVRANFLGSGAFKHAG